MKKIYALFAFIAFSFFTGNSYAQTSTYYYSAPGGVQTYTVPAGVTLISVDVIGASGGNPYFYSGGSSPVTLGGRVQCNLAVTGGQVLYLYVGGTGEGFDWLGSGPEIGGFNGGGSTGWWFAAGGGGGSDIRTSASGAAYTGRIVVAGGGGGGGDYYAPGGLGGGLTGGSGGPSPIYGGTGGGGGTQSGPGTGGLPLGALGTGGSTLTATVGGGGGGGYWGGNCGGEYDGGGGGGSSYTDTTFATAVVHTQGYSGANGNGMVKITVLCHSIGAITGAASICAGITAPLSDTSAGGTWSSTGAGIATIDSVTGIVTGLSAGIATITYVVPSVSSPANCPAIATVTVNPAPLAITGVFSVCTGASTTLSDGASGGTWSSSNTTVTTVGSTGIVTGVLPGSAIISYSLGGICSPATATVTVYPLLSSITGTMHVCAGATTTLSDGISGGTWSSTNTGAATIGTTGIVSGITPGVTTIIYTLASGCYISAAVTVNPIPSFITGLGSVCLGATTPLYDGISGGTWSSGSTGIATIGSSSGIVTSTGPGATFMTYTLPTGCSAATSIVVYSLPTPITGSMTVCVGATTTLSEATAGGTWSSGSTGIATIDLATGIATGQSPGITTITYTTATCAATAQVTVDPSPSGIVGPPSMCAGGVAYLGDITTSGTWSSGSTLIATVDSVTGVAAGVAGGTAVISYTIANGCSAMDTITVNPSPEAITGSMGICVGLTTSLADLTTGGAWSSDNTLVATVDTSSGIVTGVAAGTAGITYTMPSGCFAATAVTVNTSPATITGVPHVCAGLTTTLGDLSGGGTWSSSNTVVATTGATSGIVTGGTTTGPVIITYSLGAGCSTTAIVTVNPLPTAITGTATVCAGNTTALIDGGGGTWSSGNTAAATTGTAPGAVTGAAPGNSIITYTLPTGCTTTKTVTVNPLPPLPVAVGGGPLSVCSGGTITLTDPGGAGTWSSTTTTIANINSTSGAVTAGSSGTTLIIYKLTTTGCAASAILTVNPLPAAISGSVPFCAGATVTLSDITGGGTWSPATGTVATIGSSGIVSGVSSGTAIITYTIGTGCKRTATVTVNSLPTAISGPSAVCVSATISETDLGGSWSGGSPAVATIGSGGVVTGVALGSTSITYSLPTGCAVTKVVSVSLSPVGISGAATVCAGDTTTLGDLVSGGAWSSGSTTTATVGSLTGLVTGAAPGATIITYSLGTGCTVTKLMTVNAAPAGITGAGGVCIGSTLSLGDITTGGIWSLAVDSIATVNTSGLVSGVGAGTQLISYTVAGCSATATVTVNIAPTAISGPSTVCQGDTITLTNGVSGGTWASSHTTVATIAAGTVTGAGAGVTTINYSLGAGCIASKTITVNPISPITGATGVCVGATTTLSDLATGGVWSCPTGAGVATINAATGVVSGLGAGTAGIIYTTAAGCTATTTVTVNLAPSAIAGNLHVCAGDTTILTDAAAGGTWTSSPAGGGVVIVGYTTGVVTGVAPGTSVITYSLGSGCTVNATVTVNPLPSAIAGVATVCAGATTTFTDVTTGGTWGPSSGSIATVNATGMVTGVSAGIATITYSPGSGCSATKTITVNSTPASISGITNVCVGLTTILSDTTLGGTWSPAVGSIATVNAGGLVTAVSAGTAVISYSFPTGCAATASIIVNSAPGAIFGTMKMCIGSTTTLSDPTSGGTWSPATGSIATVNAAGVVTGVSIGMASISYIVGGCPATTVVTVNSLPGTPAAASVCIGSAIILTDSPSGGTWSSPAGAGIVMVDATSGTVTGESEGTANVTYSLGAGCTASAMVTVNPLPAAPVVAGGADNICKGYTTIVTDPAGSGTWSCSPDSIATITGTGIVTGAGGGTATISFTVGTGCSATTTISVTAVPAITGISHLCAFGDTAHVYDAMPGGTWSSTLATVSMDGLVTAYGAGLAGVTYTLSTGCYAAAPITINPVPGPITGTTNICIGTTTTLSDTATSGAWSATGAATVSLGGLVTAVSAGTAVISYVLPVTGCMKMVTVTVDAHPSEISGSANVCAGATTTLSDAVSGGVWSSGSTAIAISSAGVVTTSSPGTALITYSLAPGCTATKTITVNPLPSLITGTMQVCAGATTTLSDILTGGAWSLGLPGIATVGSATGIVTGVAAGTDIITYALPTGCATTTEITVNPLPDAGTIAGQTSLCAGSSITLTDTAAGGAWISSASGIAAVGAATGIVTGISAGTATISYSVTNTCTTATTTTNITINPLPIVAPITGADSVCISRSVTLADAISGGAWASILGNTTVSSAGIVTGVNPGTDTISYTISTPSCGSAVAELPVYVLSLNECNTGVAQAPPPSTGSGQAGEVLHVYPNPNDGAFSMSLLSAIDEQVQITITDIVGQKVRAFTTVTNRVVDIKLNEAAGVYFLSAVTAGGKYVVKVTVE